MKNQYYGDVNDYRKYGLLRCLASGGPLSIGVCWMLTPDDGRADGGLISYLGAPDEWRGYDPGLFDHLRRDVVDRNRRDIACVEAGALIPGASFCSGVVPQGKPARVGYFADVLQSLAPCQLLFFDPDNGVEVHSVAFGSRASPKYIYWRELTAAFSEGHSLLVYQHYPRQTRPRFHQHMAAEITRRMPGASLSALKTPSVVYFLVAWPEHLQALQRGLALVSGTWQSQIVVEELCSHLANPQD